MPPPGPTTRRSSSSQSSNGPTSANNPSPHVMETLHSSDWQSLLQDESGRDELVRWATTQSLTVHSKQLNETMENSELIEIVSVLRLLHHVLQKDYGKLEVECSQLKRTVEQALAENKSIRLSSKLNSVKENVLRHHFTMKTMYSVFRITPFATSEVS